MANINGKIDVFNFKGELNMAVTVSFWAGEGFNINNLAGSGLGFYGSSFGASVRVGSYQNTTFITNSTGTVQNAQCDNTTYLNTQSGIVNSSTSGININAIPNYQATLNIRVTSDAGAIKLQNPEFRIYDRSNINNDPSGVLTKAAVIVHPPESQANVGSGDSTWQTPHGSGVVGVFPTAFVSPGTSGLCPNGPSTSDSRHDHYLILSCSPNSIGSKLFGLFFSTEYL